MDANFALLCRDGDTMVAEIELDEGQFALNRTKKQIVLSLTSNQLDAIVHCTVIQHRFSDDG